MPVSACAALTGIGIWCPEPESNRYASLKAADFKSAVSTNFTIGAHFLPGASTQREVLHQPQGQGNKKGKHLLPFSKSGAGKRVRTVDLYLGKVSLYQLSYSRISEKYFTQQSRLEL